jgi:hypothetical protein
MTDQFRGQLARSTRSLAFLLGDVAIAQSAPSSLADLIVATPDGGTLEL